MVFPELASIVLHSLEPICQYVANHLVYVCRAWQCRTSMLRVFGKGSFIGDIYSNGVLVKTADYAEYFEWSYSNLNNEDRVGYFVSLNPERKIQVSGTNILGIVSATPGVIGNAPQEWPKKYLLDEWGREVIDEATGLPKLNPKYDETQTYIPRSERKEWSPVGMLGMLRVRDDGTCKVGGYCKPNEKGIATSSESGYYITNRYSKNIIEVFLK